MPPRLPIPFVRCAGRFSCDYPSICLFHGEWADPRPLRPLGQRLASSSPSTASERTFFAEEVSPILSHISSHLAMRCTSQTRSAHRSRGMESAQRALSALASYAMSGIAGNGSRDDARKFWRRCQRKGVRCNLSRDRRRCTPTGDEILRRRDRKAFRGQPDRGARRGRYPRARARCGAPAQPRRLRGDPRQRGSGAPARSAAHARAHSGRAGGHDGVRPGPPHGSRR